MKKRIVKTLEELRATPNVTQRGEVFTSADSIMTEPMRTFGGVELVHDLHIAGYIEQYGYKFRPWMWKEVEEPETRECKISGVDTSGLKNGKIYLEKNGELTSKPDNPAAGLEFPCKMLVWDDCDDVAIEREIHGYISTITCPWIDSHGANWKNAKPIPKFKPRYVWTKRYQHNDYELAKEAFSDEYYFFGDDAKYKSVDFVEIKDAEVK